MLLEKEYKIREKIALEEYKIINIVLKCQSSFYPGGYKGWKYEEKGTFTSILESSPVRITSDQELNCVGRTELLFGILNHLNFNVGIAATYDHIMLCSQDSIGINRIIDPSDKNAFSYFPSKIRMNCLSNLKNKKKILRTDNVLIAGKKDMLSLSTNSGLLISSFISNLSLHLDIKQAIFLMETALKMVDQESEHLLFNCAFKYYYSKEKLNYLKTLSYCLKAVNLNFKYIRPLYNGLYKFFDELTIGITRSKTIEEKLILRGIKKDVFGIINKIKSEEKQKQIINRFIYEKKFTKNKAKIIMEKIENNLNILIELINKNGIKKEVN